MLRSYVYSFNKEIGILQFQPHYSNDKNTIMLL
jgi:hypothetical protein